MKLNVISTVIMVFICALIAYAFYAYSPDEKRMMFTVGSFLYLLFTGIGLISFSFKENRTTVNIKTVSGIFFFIGIAYNTIAGVLGFKESAYVICLGLLFLVYVLISYSITKQRQ